MFEQVSLDLGGRKLTFETGKMARQAHGAMVARYGDTVVLATACMDNKATEKDFLPLTVDYREYTYSAGKIPGGFFKREGRPSEREILTSRLTDRPLRPLFPRRLGDRDADRCDGAFRGQRERPGRDRGDGGFRGALHFEDSVQQSDRVRARGTARRQARGQPDRCRAEDEPAEH